MLALLLLVPQEGSAQSHVMGTENGPIRIGTFASGLRYPWAMAFLPDGRMLVSERLGQLRVVSRDGDVSAPVSGLPPMFTQGQGGLQDLALAPDFAQSRRVYFTFAEPGENGTAGTAVGHARLNEQANGISNVTVIFRQQPKVEGPNHFGSRIVFTPDDKMFVVLGERFKFDPAQDPSNTLGTIVRLNLDGSVPDNNPFAGQQGRRPEIWSYGHRNIESAAIEPGSGRLLIAEMGPRGGDELTRPEAGRNYGWPVVSWGRHYDGRDIPDPPTRPEFARSLHHWTPVISPSGMAIYQGDLIPGWKGSVLIGGLSVSQLVRVRLDGDEVAGEERIGMSARVRDVAEGPDGAVYVLTDGEEGKVLKLTPAGQ